MNEKTRKKGSLACVLCMTMATSVKNRHQKHNAGMMNARLQSPKQNTETVTVNRDQLFLSGAHRMPDSVCDHANVMAICSLLQGPLFQTALLPHSLTILCANAVNQRNLLLKVFFK